MRYTCTLHAGAARAAQDWELQLRGSINGLWRTITVAQRIRGRICTLEWLCNGEPVDPGKLTLDRPSLQRFRQATAPFIKTKPNSCVPL